MFSEVGAYARCQQSEPPAHQLELQGILAPAATRAGETLALFDANISAEEWPSLVTTDIWRELPADPRLERRLDSGAASDFEGGLSLRVELRGSRVLPTHVSARDQRDALLSAMRATLGRASVPAFPGASEPLPQSLLPVMLDPTWAGGCHAG